MAIYVREAGYGATPCVTRARSAMSFGFAMTTQTIRFYFRGTVREVQDVPATRIVLQHLCEYPRAYDSALSPLHRTWSTAAARETAFALPKPFGIDTAT
jgi:hypothetical protein